MYIDSAYIKLRIGEDKFTKLFGTEEQALVVLPIIVAAAEDIVNSYLAIVTDVPLAAPNNAVKECTFTITIYMAHDRIQYADVPEWVKLKHESAIDFLENIVRGGVKLFPAKDNNVAYNVDDPRIW